MFELVVCNDRTFVRHCCGVGAYGAVGSTDRSLRSLTVHRRRWKLESRNLIVMSKRKTGITSPNKHGFGSPSKPGNVSPSKPGSVLRNKPGSVPPNKAGNAPVNRLTKTPTKTGPPLALQNKPKIIASEDGPVQLQLGLLVGGRWKVIKKLGEGGCGSVYKVIDIKTKTVAALKAESNTVQDGVLKLEVKILKRLAGRHHVAFLYQAGKKEQYSYMVTKLLGHSLDSLTLRGGKTASVSTQIRVGMQCLFGLKQLHEVGYVHRDVKPANLAVGRWGAETRVLHLLDFGLAREFVIRIKNVLKPREPRTDALFRGTPYYASVAALGGTDQGRVDDLWSMLYIMAELRDRLPWSHARSKSEILKIKTDTHDTELLYNSPPKLIDIGVHLRKLNYFSRPDYFLIYDILRSIMETSHISHSDPFDWELDGGLQKKSVRVVEEPKTIMPKGQSEEEVIEYAFEPVDFRGSPAKTVEVAKVKLFEANDFKKNEIGF